MSDGRITRWSASRTTRPCICPESPIPLISEPVIPDCFRTPRIASSAASHQFSGRCSAHSGCRMRISSCAPEYAAAEQIEGEIEGVHQHRERHAEHLTHLFKDYSRLLVTAQGEFVNLQGAERLAEPEQLRHCCNRCSGCMLLEAPTIAAAAR